MTDPNSENNFQLIFDGPVDDSEDTLRKLKGVFLTNLELSVTEAREILENLPALVKQSETEDDLKPIYQTIKEAGGKVSIRAPKEAAAPTASTSPPSAVDAFWTDESDTLDSDNVVAAVEENESDSALTLNLDFEDDDAEAATVPAVEPNQPEANRSDDLEFALSFDDDDQDTKNVLVDTPQVEIADEPETSDTLSFSLEDDGLTGSALEVAPPKESAPPAEEPPSADNDILTFSIEEDTTEAAPPAPAPPETTIKPVTAAEPTPEVSDDALTFSLEEEASEPPQTAPKKTAKTPAAPAPKDTTATMSLSLNEEPAPELSEPAPTENSVPPQIEASPKPALETTPAPEKPAAANTQDQQAADGKIDQSEDEEYVGYEYSKPSKRSLPLDMIALIVVGVAILAFANYQFSSKPSTLISVEDIDAAMLNSMDDTQTKTKKKKKTKKKEPAPLPVTIHTGKNSYGDRELGWELALQGNDITEASFKITTAEPPELTPEQIVNSEKRLPWIRKIDIEALKLAKQENGTFKGEAPAKVYLEYDGKRHRISAPAESELEYDLEASTVKGSVSVRSGFATPPEDTNLVAEVPRPGEYRLYVFAEIQAELPKPAPKPDTEDESPAPPQSE
ncbi:hypothetical protein OAO01_02325 [Oligoflexia bacterium]|nr:hypothetical protein [Oligoflexia bacterium]